MEKHSQARSRFTPWQFRTLSAAAFFMIAISWSPLLPGLLSLNSSLAFLCAFLVFAGITAYVRGLNIKVTLFFGILLSISTALLLLTQSTTLWNRTAPLGLLVFAAYEIAATKRLPHSICNLLTSWLVVGILLSIFGVLYAFNGGEPVLSIINPDGRENFLYQTTMSVAQVGNVIRPSWIYDEPGAFSFLICATVALRHLLNIEDKWSWFLIIGGLVTFSLTHVLITILFLITRLGLIRTTILTVLIVASAQPIVSEIEDFLFVLDRFSIEDGKLAGDNRSDQITNFMNIANSRIILFGDVECHDYQDRSCSNHGDISSSPVTPVYSGGLFLLTTQIIVHLVLLILFCARKKYRLPTVILSILLLQRPYFAAFGYGLITYISLFLMFNSERTAAQTATPTRRMLRPVHDS